MKVLVTGSNGFIGKNLCVALRNYKEIQLIEYDINHPQEILNNALKQVDCIIHLAGVNRPKNIDEFESCNAGTIRNICYNLKIMNRSPKILLASSIQADLNNPYGNSKRHAEEILKKYTKEANSESVIFRLKNIYGKWCKANYNSVVATFCHNIANGLTINIRNPENKIELTYIDDVVAAFIKEIRPKASGIRFSDTIPSRKITLEKLANKIKFYNEIRSNLRLPDLNDPFERALYSTYLSYLNPKEFGYGLNIKSDERGSLAEFIKSPSIGQIFVSRTKPGITRGNHFHHTKTEKFLVLQGKAVIRFRHINSDEILEYNVKGNEYRVIDIPPGYTHSIENVGRDDLVTLFWVSEEFNPKKTDTYSLPVKK